MYEDFYHLFCENFLKEGWKTWYLATIFRANDGRKSYFDTRKCREEREVITGKMQGNARLFWKR